MDITGLDRSAVLAALYNAARPQGMGFLAFDPTPMGREEAQEILGGLPLRDAYIDYLKGRVMKIDVTRDSLDTHLYNRDNGPGAAEAAIRAMVGE